MDVLNIKKKTKKNANEQNLLLDKSNVRSFLNKCIGNFFNLSNFQHYQTWTIMGYLKKTINCKIITQFNSM